MESVNCVEVIVGTVTAVITVIGVIVMGLKKLDLITFGKQKMGCGIPINSKGNLSECSSHPDVVKMLSQMHDQQVKHVALHDQHLSKQENARKEFSSMRQELKVIGQAIAVLLDRTGGRPKGLYDG